MPLVIATRRFGASTSVRPTAGFGQVQALKLQIKTLLSLKYYSTYSAGILEFSASGAAFLNLKE